MSQPRRADPRSYPCSLVAINEINKITQDTGRGTYKNWTKNKGRRLACSLLSPSVLGRGRVSGPIWLTTWILRRRPLVCYFCGNGQQIGRRSPRTVKFIIDLLESLLEMERLFCLLPLQNLNFLLKFLCPPLKIFCLGLDETEMTAGSVQ